MYEQVRKGFARGCVTGFCVMMCGCTLLANAREPAPTAHGSHPAGSLEARMQSFVASFDSISAQDFVEFFPREGDVVYQHTRHTPEGDEVIVQRFRSEEIPLALKRPGPLWASFQFQFEGQPIGLLTHQAMVRTGTWRRVARLRFVPPDANSMSPAYVEWRVEGPKWVISELGDESFVDVPLPLWVRE